MKVTDANASDEMLWNAIQEGNEIAFKVVFNRFLPTLLATARHYLKDENTCENVVQDLFLNIWLKRQTLRINDFKSYFTASARYEVYKVLKKQKSLNGVLYTDQQLENSTMVQMNEAEERYDASALKNQLASYLLELPKRCREIFLLSRQEHLSNAEIAARLNISKRSVENQLSLALNHLKLHLKDYTSASVALTIVLAISAQRMS